MAHSQHCSDQNCRAGLEPWFYFGCACFGVVELFLVKNETVLSPNPKNKELKFHPCVNRESREIISASVELRETEV